jgi:hypothetical protein
MLGAYPAIAQNLAMGGGTAAGVGDGGGGNSALSALTGPSAIFGILLAVGAVWYALG